MDPCSRVPIPPPEHSLTASASLQGDLFQYREAWNWLKSPPPDRRGTIGGFSRGARLRLLKEIAVIDWDAAGDCLFLTLTYPDSLGPCTYKERSKHRYLLQRSIEKYLGRHVATLWRTEWQDRKSGARLGQIMPHLHVLLFGVEYLPWQDLRTWWRSAIGVKGPCHTYVQHVANGTGAAKYAAKYAAKDCSSSLVSAAYLNNLFGRAWGMTRKQSIPRAAKVCFRELTIRQEHLLGKTGKLMTRNPSKGPIGSYTLFGEGGRQVVRMILDHTLPPERESL